uniref:hypothetical protein n=1 Tax=Halanaeroarchaeum sulfurireducens TaxID=1604004 RepID=UPI00163EA0B4|nr:hypothetical protein [Halanaeroarchaeum sulfurireducens]
MTAEFPVASDHPPGKTHRNQTMAAMDSASPTLTRVVAVFRSGKRKTAPAISSGGASAASA